MWKAHNLGAPVSRPKAPSPSQSPRCPRPSEPGSPGVQVPGENPWVSFSRHWTRRSRVSATAYPALDCIIHGCLLIQATLTSPPLYRSGTRGSAKRTDLFMVTNLGRSHRGVETCSKSSCSPSVFTLPLGVSGPLIWYKRNMNWDVLWQRPLITYVIRFPPTGSDFTRGDNGVNSEMFQLSLHLGVACDGALAVEIK